MIDTMQFAATAPELILGGGAILLMLVTAWAGTRATVAIGWAAVILFALAIFALAGPVGSAVACTFPAGDTWVGLQVLRLEPDRFMIVVHDVTTEQRLARREAQAALEINDTVVQTLVAAETALDLGRAALARSLVAEASKASRAWIGQQLVASGGARPGAVRREGPSRPQREAGRPGGQDDTR